MFVNLKPERRASSVYTIDFSKEYAAGVRGLILDIDNTLVPQDAPADARSEKLIRALQEQGFRICLISNNGLQRVKSFADAVGAEFYVEHAHKPLRKAYYRALQVLSTDREHTLFIGDQLFTDVWGARRAGVRHVLVDPIDLRSDTVPIRIKRFCEKPFLRQNSAEMK